MVVLIAGLVAGMYLLLPGRHSPAADEKPTPAPANEFANKFVFVNFKTGGAYQAQLVQNATVRRLGSREFLVGEMIVKEAGEENWKGAILWAPVESIDTIMVFSNKAQAMALIESAQKAPEKK